MVIRTKTRHGVVILPDCKWLSKNWLDTGHVVALANRRQAWLTTPLRTVSWSFFSRRLEEQYTDYDDRDDFIEVSTNLYHLATEKYTAEIVDYINSNRNLQDPY